MEFGALKANPIALPRNGAEQGVLSKTKRAPVKKAPDKPSHLVAPSILVKV
jgi:hypothetical protein